jgi:hypothetical protein
LKRFAALGAVLALLACGGCAAAIPAATGSAPVVGQFIGEGEGDSFWLAKYDNVVKAALDAAEQLSLTVDSKETEDDSVELQLSDDTGARVRLRIQRRTETVTRVQFEAVSRGTSGLSRLLGRQMIDELHDAKGFLADWSEEEKPPAQ